MVNIDLTDREIEYIQYLIKKEIGCGTTIGTAKELIELYDKLLKYH